MSIANEITRLTNIRNKIRQKLIGLCETNNNHADLEECADIIDNMNNNVYYSFNYAFSQQQTSYKELVIDGIGPDYTLKRIFVNQIVVNLRFVGQDKMIWNFYCCKNNNEYEYSSQLYCGQEGHVILSFQDGDIKLSIDNNYAEERFYPLQYRYIAEWEYNPQNSQ